MKITLSMHRTVQVSVGLMMSLFAFVALAQDEKPVAKRQSTKSQAAPVPRLETLEIRTAKNRYLGGEPVVVLVSLANKSAKPISFLTLNPKLEWKVKRENKIVGLSYKGKDESNAVKISFQNVAVGASYSYPVVLNRLFDLSRAGDYVVSCEKYLKNEPGADLVGPRLVSKSLKFSIAEDDFKAAPQ